MNFEIKQYAKQNHVKLWQLAERLGINDGNLSRRLRREFTEDEKARVKAIIDDIAAGQQEA